uniref:Uncharacterized protein n=2 Tax=Acrobeloides nanus TaxID=290746 RepID=A0A914E3Z0_9BILA
MKLRTLIEPSEQVLIFEDGIRIESYLRIWHNNRWYLRYAVCERRTQSQPAVFVVYRNEDHYQKRHHADIILLNNYIGYEYGFKIKQTDRTLAIILKDFVLALSFRHVKNMVFWKEWFKDVCGRSAIFYMAIKGIPNNVKILLNTATIRLHLVRDAFLFVQGSPPKPLLYISLKDLLEVECVDDTLTFKTRAILSHRDQYFWFVSDQVPELKDRLKRLLESKQFQKCKTDNLIKPPAAQTMPLPRKFNFEGIQKEKEYVNTFPRTFDVKQLEYANVEVIQNVQPRTSNGNMHTVCREVQNDLTKKSPSMPSFKLFVDAAKKESKLKAKGASGKISTTAFQDTRYQNWVKATRFVKALRKKSQMQVSKSTEVLSNPDPTFEYPKTREKKDFMLTNSQDSETRNAIFPMLDCSPASFMDPVSCQQNVPSGLVKMTSNNRFNMSSLGSFLAKKLRTSMKGSYSRYDGERSTPDFQDEDVETSSKFGAIDCAIKRGQERLRRSDRRNSGFPLRPISRTGTIISDTSSLDTSEIVSTPLAQSQNQNTMPAMYAIEERSSINSSATLAKESPSTVVNSTISISGADTTQSSKGSIMDHENDFEVHMADSTLSLPAQNYALPSPSLSMQSSISVQSEFGPNGTAFSRNGSHRRSKQKQMERFFHLVDIPPELPPRKYTAPANSYIHDVTKHGEHSKSKPSLEYLQWSSCDSENQQSDMTSSSPKKIGFVSESVNYVDISTQSFSNLHQTKHADTVKMNYLSSPMVKSNSMFTLDR